MAETFNVPRDEVVKRCIATEVFLDAQLRQGMKLVLHGPGDVVNELSFLVKRTYSTGELGAPSR